MFLMETQAGSGAGNMAVDEALLEAARLTGLVSLRFYRWREPTLSLGYFQKQLPAGLPADLLKLPCVRRLSGGGAILHHHEWTYSCSLPSSHRLASEPLRLYELVHREIVDFLSEQDISANFRGQTCSGCSEQPFLCFGREDPRDLVLGQHKIVGSAQRRRRGAILQHGSILLKRSPFADIYPGLCDLSTTNLSSPDRLFPLARKIARLIFGSHEEPMRAELPDQLAEHAELLEQEKYQQLAWR